MTSARPMSGWRRPKGIWGIFSSRNSRGLCVVESGCSLGILGYSTEGVDLFHLFLINTHPPRITMIPRPARILRAIPSISSSSSASARNAARPLSTSSPAAQPTRERGITLDAKSRVQQHIRNIQSSSKAAASPAVRPAPAQHFQPPPQSLPSSAVGSDNPLDRSKVRDGLDYS